MRVDVPDEKAWPDYPPASMPLRERRRPPYRVKTPRGLTTGKGEDSSVHRASMSGIRAAIEDARMSGEW